MIPARWRLPLFALLCVAQLSVAGAILLRSERTLARGELYRFRTEPVDPADLVRGRYVALRFQATQAPIAAGAVLVDDMQACAEVEVDREGFASIRALHALPPEHDAWLRVRVRNVGTERADFELPVDRFYMPEEQAPAAEQLYGEAQRQGRGTWAEIRVHAGRAAIEQLYIDGVPAGLAVQRAREATAVPQP